MVIRELREEDVPDWNGFDDSFTVDSELVLSLKGRQIEFTVREVAAYTKSYDDEQDSESVEEDYSDYIGNANQIVYLAWSDNEVVGRIVLKRNWNHYALIEDIAVDKSFRSHGIGRKLMDQAKWWAKNGGMPGIMLETQSNNVSACKFYQSCGFAIGGMDFHLYRGMNKGSNEAAIFWYFMFED